MGELGLSQAAQQWVNVVLIWVGFGTLAGLLAKCVLPGHDPAGAVVTLVMGIAGSMVGLLAMTLLCWQLSLTEPPNPISPLGLLSAAAGAFCLLVLYRLIVAATAIEGDEDGSS